MPDLEPLQRIFLHMVRDLALCEHAGDVADDLIALSKIFGVDLPEDDDDDGFDNDAIEAMLACEKPGKHGEDFRALVRAERLAAIDRDADRVDVLSPVPVSHPYFVVEIEDQDERGLDQHAALEILRAALPGLGFKLRACGTRESMRQYFADEQARLDREDLAELLTEHRLARAAREAEEDSR